MLASRIESNGITLSNEFIVGGTKIIFFANPEKSSRSPGLAHPAFFTRCLQHYFSSDTNIDNVSIRQVHYSPDQVDQNNRNSSSVALESGCLEQLRKRNYYTMVGTCRPIEDSSLQKKEGMLYYGWQWCKEL
jgi:hypothetical protein